MYGCESWTIKKSERQRMDAFDLWCWRSPLDCREIQPIHLKGNQSWIFTGRTDTEAEALVLWLPDVKGWLIWKDPDGGKDRRQEEKGMTEDEMVGWITNLVDMCLNRLQELVMDREAWRAAVYGWQRVGHDWVTKLNWTHLENQVIPRGPCQKTLRYSERTFSNSSGLFFLSTVGIFLSSLSFDHK